MPNENLQAVINLLLLNEHVPYAITSDIVKSSVIEILVHDREEFVKKLGLKRDKTKENSKREIYKWRSGIKSYLFLIRAIEDCYYHPALFERLLKGRRKDEVFGIYAPHQKDKFFGLLYIARYRKNAMTPEEFEALKLSKPDDYKNCVSDRDYSHQFLCNLGYFPMRSTSEDEGYYGA